MMDDRMVGYRCRRGLLELDQILVPFFNSHYQQLTEAQKSAFKMLLEQTDPQLQAWFFGGGDRPKIVATILKIMQQSLSI